MGQNTSIGSGVRLFKIYIYIYFWATCGILLFHSQRKYSCRGKNLGKIKMAEAKLKADEVIVLFSQT